MTDEIYDLTGAVALVTGGNSGIGRAIALTYARAGASVAIIGRNPEKNASVLDELKTVGHPSLALEVDVSDRAKLKPAVERVEHDLGPISILLNNAGTAAPGGVLTVGLEDWDRVIETNLTAAFLLSKYAAHSMVQHRRGKIINIASASISYGWARNTAYAVSKAALAHLTRCMAVELGPFNVQSNAIVPGWVDTELVQRVRNGPMYDATIALTPAGRWAEPQEIANAALFLASGASDFVNGTTMVVDGGMTQTYGASPPDRNLPDF